ncbi:hypothetical protein AB0L99_16920 [Streptomyces sp. NPDC051954]
MREGSADAGRTPLMRTGSADAEANATHPEEAASMPEETPSMPKGRR